MTKLKSLTIITLVAVLTSCTNYSVHFDDFSSIIKSKEPLKPVESLSVDNDTPEDLMIYNANDDGGFKSMTSVDYNWSGNLGGPSSMNLSFDEANKVIVLYTRNTTGSPYTGYRTWNDTYYLPFDKETWVYEGEFKDSTYYGIGFKSEISSDMGTTEYRGNIYMYEEIPNRLLVKVFGAGNSDWSVRSQYYFKKDLFNEFMELRSSIEETSKP